MASPIGKLDELGAAGEPVSQYEGVRMGGNGRQQVMLSHLHRHLVVAFLDSKVAGQPTAPADGCDAGPRRCQQGRIGLPPDDRGMVAVRLDDQLDAAQVGRCPVRRTLQQLGEGEYAGGDLGNSRIPGSSSAASLRHTARQDGSRPITGVPRAMTGCKTSSAFRSLPSGTVELSGADQVRPQAGGSFRSCGA